MLNFFFFLNNMLAWLLEILNFFLFIFFYIECITKMELKLK